MRDDSARWNAPSSLDYASDDLSVTEVTLPSQIWVSGTDVLQIYKDKLVSWPDIVAAQNYALALRRDRLLLVGAAQPLSGFNIQPGHATSDVSDAYKVIDISGKRAFNRLRHGAELNLDKPSASVMRRAFGVDVLLYRVGTDARFRVHVPRALMQSVFQQLIS